MDDLAQYGALGLVCASLLGGFAVFLRQILSVFVKQIERAGKVADEQVRAMAHIADRLNGVREDIGEVDTHVCDLHKVTLAETRRLADQHTRLGEQHVEIRMDIQRALGPKEP